MAAQRAAIHKHAERMAPSRSMADELAMALATLQNEIVNNETEARHKGISINRSTCRIPKPEKKFANDDRRMLQSQLPISEPGHNCDQAQNQKA